MSRLSTSLRGAAVAAAIAGLAFASFAPAQASTAQNVAKLGNINTYKSWDHAQSIGSFGRPDTSTYGQVITIPDGKTSLNKFVFNMNDEGASGTMVIRGEIYAWDGSEATGSAIYESTPMTLSYGDTDFHKVKFVTGGAAVTPGEQYVIFASVDRDYDSCTDGYTNVWGAVPDTTYTGGTFVYQNDGGDASQWTTVPWDTIGLDLAFKASF